MIPALVLRGESDVAVLQVPRCLAFAGHLVCDFSKVGQRELHAYGVTQCSIDMCFGADVWSQALRCTIVELVFCAAVFVGFELIHYT